MTVSSGSGTFDVSILVTPSQKGLYTSPRTSGSCTADPNGAIVESNESNNDCRLGGLDVPDTVAVYSSVDLGVTDVGSPDPNVVAGSLGGADNLTHTITVTNHGPDATSGAIVTIDFGDGLPPGAQLDTATPSSGSYDSANRIWTIGSLANNAQATLTLTFSVATGTANDATVTTHANVEPPEFQFISDPDSSDDEATVATGVQDSGVVQTVGVTPSSKDFGSQRVGTMSTAQTFTITNHDSATLNIATVALVGTNPDQFSNPADTCSNQAILPSQSCTVAVAFTPTTTGAQTANLEITSDALSGPTEIILHGSGTQSVISASPSSASFGNETVNKTSTAQDFLITNNGTATLQIGLVTLGGNDASQYVESSDACSHAALNAGQSCTVSLAFRPTSTGAQNDATLDIASDDPGGTFHIALSGSGVAPTVSAGPLSKNFGSQPINSTGAAQTFQIKNTGNAALTIGGIALAGADAAQYTMSSNTCPSQLATNATCTVDVAFAPTTAGQHNSATLNIASDDPSGTFVHPARPEPASPTRCPWRRSQRTSATSASARPARPRPSSSRTPGPPRSRSLPSSSRAPTPRSSPPRSNTCTQPLAPNATCSIDVAFAPTTSGSLAATLDISSDGAPAVDQVSVSGTGILGAITSSMNSHDFGNQRVGTTSAAQRVTVTNTGTDILVDLQRRARRHRRHPVHDRQRRVHGPATTRGIEMHDRRHVQTDEHGVAPGCSA